MHQSKTKWNFIVNCKSNHRACENEIDRLHEHAERVYDASIVGKKSSTADFWGQWNAYGYDILLETIKKMPAFSKGAQA